MSNIKLFESKQVRSQYNEEEEKWYFSIVYLIEVLTDFINSTDYVKKLRKRNSELGRFVVLSQDRNGR